MLPFTPTPICTEHAHQLPDEFDDHGFLPLTGVDGYAFLSCTGAVGRDAAGVDVAVAV